MAKVRYAAPIANIEGAWAPGCVCRQKKFKVGKKIVLGPQEVFHRRKRDYKHKPPTEAEQQGIERFRQAEAHRKQEMQDPGRAAYWQERFFCSATETGGREHENLSSAGCLRTGNADEGDEERRTLSLTFGVER